MLLKCGAKHKFMVIKIDDTKKYLSLEQQAKLVDILDTIQIAREKEGKNPNNEYLVINTDEPYVPEIIEILKRNGHWG